MSKNYGTMKGYASKWLNTCAIKIDDNSKVDFDFYNAGGRIFMWWSGSYNNVTFVIDGWFVV